MENIVDEFNKLKKKDKKKKILIGILISIFLISSALLLVIFFNDKISSQNLDKNVVNVDEQNSKTSLLKSQGEGEDLEQELSSKGIKGMNIVKILINEDEITKKEKKDSDYDLRTEFTDVRNKVHSGNTIPLKQDIYLKNNKLTKDNFNFSTVVQIDYNEVNWNGTKYTLTNNPIKFTSWIDKETNKTIAPNIFMDDKYYKRINYQDVAEQGGYALAYSKDGNYYIELKIDNININSNEEKKIDPTYYNQTDGFSIFYLCGSSCNGLYTNNSDFWITDYSKGFIYHVNKTGGNQTDGFSSLTFSSGILRNIVSNVTSGTPTDFWSPDDSRDFLYHFNASGNNISDGFQITSNSYGLYTNNSDFWTTDALISRLYHYTKNGSLVSDISLSSYPNPRGIVSNVTSGTPTDFWITGLQGFIYHINITGSDKGDGFSTLKWGIGEPYMIVSNVTSGTPTDFWIFDTGDKFIYHLGLTDVFGPTIIFSTYNNSLTQNTNLNINFSISDESSLSSCWYSNDSMSVNTTITCGTNITGVTWSAGNHNITIWANDTAGNVGINSISFTILADGNINKCGYLLDANSVYTLTQNVSSTGTCFTILENNITLEGNGYEINYSYGGIVGYGIYSSGYNYFKLNNFSIIKEGLVTGNSKYSIYLDNIKNSSISNFSVKTIGSSSDGLHITSSTLTNFSNIFITTTTLGTTYSFYLSSSNNNNIFSNNVTGGDYGYYFTSSANNLLFDCINISGATNIQLASSSKINITNCSYPSETVASGNILIRKWYYQAYVNDTNGNPVGNVNITAFNVSNIYNFNLTTNSIGWTNITEIIDYINNGGTKYYYSNYTIYATNTTLLANHQYNISQYSNKLDDYFTIVSGVDITPPSVLFNNQNPADIDSFNALAIGVNISYNISDVNLNLSTIKLFEKINSSLRADTICSNGSCFSGYAERDYLFNISETFSWNLDDNAVYPATYNFQEQLMKNYTKIIGNLTSANQYVAMEFLNVTNLTKYNFFEIMANSTSIMRFYYCNSSYGFSNNIIFNSNCIQIETLPANNPFNHTHTENSKHQVVSLAFNTTTGKIGTVQITSKSYIMLRGNNVATNSVRYYYISNNSRTGATRTTSNTGNTWTNQTFTVDAHIHQFSDSDSLFYYVCANDTLNNQNCTGERQDLYQLVGLPPSPINIYYPTNNFYNGDITINYTEALSPNGYAISYYNISLAYPNGTYISTIKGNNSLNLSFVWDSTGTVDGNYTIKVRVYDNLSQSSIGTSEEFGIDNSLPYFSNLESNNNTLELSGAGKFGVTIEDTNGTVWLDINGVNISAVNYSSNVYNASYTFTTNGTYAYRWWAYGNGTGTFINKSEDSSYFVKPDTTPPTFTTFTNKTIKQNAKLNYQIVATDYSGISCFTVNDTNFAINCSGYLVNNTLLDSIRTYWLNISVNDTLDNTAYGIMFVNVTASTTTGGASCRYKSFGYWNNRLPFFKESGCT